MLLDVRDLQREVLASGGLELRLDDEYSPLRTSLLVHLSFALVLA